MTESRIRLTRLGPVFLYWSEYNDAAVIGPSNGAWGGDDVYRCDAHPDWQTGDSDAYSSVSSEAEAHAALHGYSVAVA